MELFFIRTGGIKWCMLLILWLDYSIRLSGGGVYVPSLRTKADKSPEIDLLVLVLSFMVS